VKALYKPGPQPGFEFTDQPEPEAGFGEVKIRVLRTGICGTDLHIESWDAWAAGAVDAPLVPGHEFCGNVVAVGDEVTTVKEGDFVSAEMHVACGKCYQCRIGEAHICPNVKIIGIDEDGAFAEYVRIPESNIWKIDPSIPPDYASLLDPLGNAVYTVLSGEIAACSVAIVGCGPIGLFAIAVARAVGATQIFALEPNAHRAGLAKKMKADVVIDPTKQDAKQIIFDATNGVGADVVLEMSGKTPGIRTGFDVLRMGGRMSMLGTPSKPVELDLAKSIIFKGATVIGIHGRLMYKTWFQMQNLLKAGKLDLSPVITDRIPMKDFAKGMDRLKTGESSKILLYPNGQE